MLYKSSEAFPYHAPYHLLTCVSDDYDTACFELIDVLHAIVSAFFRISREPLYSQLIQIAMLVTCPAFMGSPLSINAKRMGLFRK